LIYRGGSEDGTGELVSVDALETAHSFSEGAETLVVGDELGHGIESGIDGRRVRERRENIRSELKDWRKSISRRGLARERKEARK
jgi:hypothetical protein